MKSFQVGEIVVNVDLNQVHEGDTFTKLKPKEMEVLTVLYQNKNNVVTRRELLKEVWGESNWNDAGLTQAISTIRNVLNDENSQLIQTIPKKGYRMKIGEQKTENRAELDWRKKILPLYRENKVLISILIILFVIFLMLLVLQPKVVRKRMRPMGDKTTLSSFKARWDKQQSFTKCDITSWHDQDKKSLTTCEASVVGPPGLEPGTT